MTASTTDGYDSQPVNVRIKISALWATMLFVFAYVDIFSLYREDFRTGLDAGEISGFEVTHSFLFLTTLYVVLPSVMIALTMFLAPEVNRIVNLVLGSLYALTIVGGAVGEWSYYVFGSLVEVVLLAAIAYLAWTWPKTLA